MEPVTKLSTEEIKDNTENNQKELDENKLAIFRQTVKKWLDLDNEIRTLDNALKERKKNRKEIQQQIMNFMGEYNIKNMNTDDGKLTYNESKTKKPLNINYIKSSLTNYFNNSEDGEKVTEYLLNKREVSKRVYLKRTFSRK